MAQTLEPMVVGEERMPKRRPPGQPRKHSQLTVAFSPAALEELEAEAARREIAPSTLIRMWVVERLDQLRRERERDS